MDREAMETTLSHGPMPDTPPTMHHAGYGMTTCACQQWLVSRESEHCGLCNRWLPAVGACQLEHFEQRKSLMAARHQLVNALTTQAEHQDALDRLAREAQQKEEQLEGRVSVIESLRQDVSVLHQKYTSGISQQKEIESSKESVERELEDLSHLLQKEATKMVVSEQVQKEKLLSSHRTLLEQLANAKGALANVEVDLQQLRHEFAQTSNQCVHVEPAAMSTEDGVRVPCVNQEAYTVRACIDLTWMMDALLQRQSSLNVQVGTDEDPALVAEYGEFKEALTTVPYSKIHTLAYMKQCLKYDIVPCLRFGASPRIASRKIVQAVLANTLYIETSPTGHVREQIERHRQQQSEIRSKSGLWERLASPSTAWGCHACGRPVDLTDEADAEQVLPFRFRLSPLDEWWCIDTHCRDRLMAVIAFYAHVRQLQLGHFHARPLAEPYRLCCQLKLQMYLSRMGALPLFQP